MVNNVLSKHSGGRMETKIFVYCSNFNNSCKSTKEIQNEFGQRIALMEGEYGEIEKHIRDVGKAVAEISSTHCQNCGDFIRV